MKNIFTGVALTLAALAAHADIQTLGVWDGSSYIQSRGLVGVGFVSSATNASGQFVALGAHPYINGATMPNDGVSTFYANPGLNPGAPAGQTRANWSFDFAFNLGQCTGCTIELSIDTDPGFGVTMQTLTGITTTDINADNGNWLESWNIEMAHITALNDFDPMANGVYRIEMAIRNAAGGPLGLTTAINVVVGAVPEPTSVALVGAALLGAFGVSRRRRLSK